MHSRQRYPLHGHIGQQMMGPGPFGGHQQTMIPYGGSGQMMGYQHQPMNGRRQMMGQTMGRGQGRRTGGGLLSKILGGKKQGNPQAVQRGLTAGRSVSSSGSGGVGSILQTLSNPNGLTGFLNNTQQVLNTVQSFGPMIQQYGPIVKNLPMMWKLYKGFKDLPSEEKADVATETPIVAEDSVQSEAVHKQKPRRNKTIQPETDEERTLHSGTSTPKLYI